MNSHFIALLVSYKSSLILGFSIATCFISCFLCFSFFLRFKHKSLLYLGLTIIAFQFLIVMNNYLPVQYSPDLPSTKILTHLSGALIVCSFYKLFMVTFTPFPNFKFITPRFYTFLIVAVLLIRVFVIFYPSLVSVRILATSHFLFFGTTLFLCLTIKSKSRSLMMLRIGTGIGVLCLSIYPLIRLGVLTSHFLSYIFSYILIVTITTFSILSLIGAIELGREYLDRAEKASIRNMARAFIQLRDLVNTPFQTIEFSVQLLRLRNPKEVPTLQKIEKALKTLRRVDAALAKYESNVDWNQTDNFIELDSESNNL